jgi:hypothetical protein
MPFQRPGARAAPACALLRTALAAAPAARADDGVTVKPRKGHLRAGRTLTIIAPANCADPEARSVPAPAPAAARGGTGRPIRTPMIKTDTAPHREHHRHRSHQTEHAHLLAHLPFPPLLAERGARGQTIKVYGPVSGGGRLESHRGRTPGGLRHGRGPRPDEGALGGLWLALWTRRRVNG